MTVCDLPATILSKHVGTFEIEVSDLKVDPGYQRVLDPLWVSRTTKSFDPAYLGVAHVSRRPDGDYLVDGQGRRALCLAANHPTLTCKVFSGLTYEEEASLFVKLNNFRSMRYIAKLRAAIQAGDAEAVAIRDACAAAGFGVADALPGGGHGLRCAQVLYSVIRKYGPSVLTETLRVLSKAYGNSPAACHKDMIAAVAALIGKNPDLDMDRLHRTLVTYSASHLYWTAAGKDAARLYGSPSKGVEALIGRAYNSRLRARGKIKHVGSATDKSSDRDEQEDGDA